ncbi:PREDICTED: NADH-cytochrome b5 reductase-like isoform X2 [Ceratosolen solmsi marchali]|uniref:NADH-cytochrome b5 reductase-like isoform X2 n=1 Tax=Ceratosolen solmsi marchali TaxID=326594 RepID=A0AAJ6VMG2_9HYME|nr:PREDICTED: NADH-cytochrome b5 reductase-like isoform X2 [Ceratosolen solmsi marchali]
MINGRMTSFDDVNVNDRPTTPLEQDCCGNGCDPCIFDVHKKLLEEWKEEKYNKSKRSAKNFLSLVRYKRFIVKNIVEGSENSICIELDCASDNKDDVIFLLPSQYIMMKLFTTTKPYTPISWNRRSMNLLIKLYPSGEASTYVKQLNINDELLIRGPYGNFNYSRNSYKNIIMLSIGSGIAAFYPLAASIVKDELEDTKINMMLGFRFLSHVPLKDELRILTDYWNFECTLYLSQGSTANITGLNIVNSRINSKIIDRTLDSYSPETTLILICGTTKFNEIMENFVQKKDFCHYHVFR